MLKKLSESEKLNQRLLAEAAKHEAARRFLVDLRPMSVDRIGQEGRCCEVLREIHESAGEITTQNEGGAE